MKKVPLVFIIVTAYLSLLQFTVPNLIGFDGYSHTRIASLIPQTGFIESFPWLPFTHLNANYANVQILFHLVLIPFTAGIGPKIAATVFSAIFFSIFYWILTEWKIKYSWLYTSLLILGSTNLTYRFLLTRPFILGLTSFILVVYFLHKKNHKALGIVFMFYSLLYSGFIFGLAAVVIYFAIGLLNKKMHYKLLIFSFVGAFLGLAINPYFPENIAFLFTQWLQVNLNANLFNQEWRSWPIMELIQFSWIFLVAYLGSIISVIKERNYKSATIFFLAVTTIFLFALFTSRRFLEYFAPLSIILFAITHNQHVSMARKIPWMKYFMGIILIALLVFNVVAVREHIHNNNFLPRFNKCVEWADKNLPDNSLIFNNAYTFNYLFYHIPQFKYTHGIDLTYSFLHDEDTFDRYMNVLQGNHSTSNIVIDDYNADYVLIGKIKQDVDLFAHLNQHAEDFELRYDDLDCTILEVKKMGQLS